MEVTSLASGPRDPILSRVRRFAKLQDMAWRGMQPNLGTRGRLAVTPSERVPASIQDMSRYSIPSRR